MKRQQQQQQQITHPFLFVWYFFTLHNK